MRFRERDVMNHEPQTFVDLHETGNAQSHLLLQAIARHADWDTGICHPSARTLSRMAKCSEKTARRHLKRLEDDGYISRHPHVRADGSQGADEIVLVGYQAWIAANRSGGKVSKPRKGRRYADGALGSDGDSALGQRHVHPPGHPDHPPGQDDQPPLDTDVTSPPGQQVTSPKNSLPEQVSEDARGARASAGSISDFEVKCRAALTASLGEAKVAEWFAGARFIRHNDDMATLRVPERFKRNWIATRFDAEVRWAVASAASRTIEKIHIVIAAAAEEAP